MLSTMPKILVKEGPRELKRSGCWWQWTWARFCICCCVTRIGKKTKYRVHAALEKVVGEHESRIKEMYREDAKRRSAINLQALRRGIRARTVANTAAEEMRTRIVARYQAQQVALLHWVCLSGAARWIGE
eukprot:SAG11_NODE_1074_length_5968_cov_2.041063_10_plen_130_part_00